MVYVVGIIGFFIGFFAGQLLLLKLLKGRSNEEVLSDPYIKWTYGILNWIFAGMGAYSFVFLYQYYFGA